MKNNNIFKFDKKVGFLQTTREFMPYDMMILDKAVSMVSKLSKPLKTKYSIEFDFSTLYYIIKDDKKLMACVNIDKISPISLYFSYLFNDKYHNSDIIIQNESKHLTLPENGIYTIKLDSTTAITCVVSEGIQYNSNSEYKSFRYTIVGLNTQTWIKRLKYETTKLYCKHFLENKGSIVVTKSGNSNKIIYPKNIADIVMDEDKKNTVLKQIRNFMENKDVYQMTNTPYKLGVLIDGEPGTGKSSFAYSLAKMIRCNVTIITPEEIKFNSRPGYGSSYGQGSAYTPSFGIAPQMKQQPSRGRYAKSKSGKFNILLIEEIDALMETNTKDTIVETPLENESPITDPVKKEISLLKTDVLFDESEHNKRSRKKRELIGGSLRRDEILRYIDDLPENTILIATTNKLNTLDEAMIRQGRFDIKFEMGFFNKEQAEMMVAKYGFDESFLEKYEGKFPICPASIQFDMVQKICEDTIKGGND